MDRSTNAARRAWAPIAPVSRGRWLFVLLALLTGLGCGDEEAAAPEQETVQDLLDADSTYTIKQREDVERLVRLGGQAYVLPGHLHLVDTPLEDIAALKGLREVEGDLVIRGNAALASLAGLDNLHRVGRSLIIADNAALADLQGLGDLVEVRGSLRLEELQGLRSLNGLGLLKEVHGPLVISGNPLLESLDGLQALLFAGALFIEGNSVLHQVDALAELDHIKGRLVLRDNPQLTSMKGLFGLVTLGGEIGLGGNGAFDALAFAKWRRDFEGSKNVLPDTLYTVFSDSLLSITNTRQFERLALLAGRSCRLEGSLVISGDELSRVDGLEGIKAIEGRLIVAGTSRLTSLNGLSGLKRIAGGVLIEDNAALANLDGLVGLQYLAGQAMVRGNPQLKSLGRLAYLPGEFELVLEDNDGLGRRKAPAVAAEQGVLANPQYRLQSRADIDRMRRLGGASYRLAGNLYISGAELTDLKGLEGLTSIGGSLHLEMTARLASVDGLHRLKQIGGGLFIKDNKQLRQVDGLSNLQQIGD